MIMATFWTCQSQLQFLSTSEGLLKFWSLGADNPLLYSDRAPLDVVGLSTNFNCWKQDGFPVQYGNYV